MFLPLVSFIFLFVHWKTAAKPFFVSLLGVGIFFLSTMFVASTGESETTPSIVKSTSTTSGNKKKNNKKFQCNGKIYCSEMSSCAEAKFYLRNCPGTKIDGDNDRIPCEKQWCSN
ncbi:MAG: calcium-binding protein [Candidatus Electrothrix sp. AR3]|nr:calcium-binding protein [Candidatus Electrothrix sp. AR3]